jgi:hypothetical protein
MVKRKISWVLLTLLIMFGTVFAVTDINQVFATSVEDEPACITSVTAGNFTNVSVFLKNNTSSRPTGDMFNVVRKINGIEDESFIWKDGTIRWDSEDKVLVFAYLPYVQGAEYIVTDKTDDEIQNDIDDTTQMDVSRLSVIFNKAPSTNVTATTVDVKGI